MSEDLNRQSRSRWEKLKNDPAPAIGVTGFVGVVGYAVWNYFRRGSTMKPSVYVIQTRVAAQSLVIGLLTMSVGYNIYQHLRYDDGKEKENALNYSHFEHPAQHPHHPIQRGNSNNNKPTH